MTGPGRLLSTSLTAGDSAVPRIVGDHGVWFRLADGREVIDASNTARPLGHCHPEVTAAIRQACDAPVVNEGWHWAEREQAAAELLDIALAGEDWAGAARFFVSANEANDAALALCQAFTGRPALATGERAYHGGAGLAWDMTVQQWHGGLSSASGVAAPPRLATVHELPAPRGARITGQPDPTAGAEWIPAARADLADSAAVLLDYSQGGVYHSPAYQDRMASLAREAGALWIADETVTGFGRVGGWFQFQHGRSRQDIMTLGKCLSAGGAAAGAVVLSRDLLNRMGAANWQSYSTYRAHPAAMATIRAHLRISSRDRVYQRARELDGYMLRRLTEVVAQHPSVRRADGRGLHWTIELAGPDWRDWRGEDTNPLASRALRPPRLQPPLPPHVGDLHVRHAQLGGQQPGRPVRHPQPLRRRLQRGQHDGHIVGDPRLARPGPVLQPAGPLSRVPLLPQNHRRLGHPGRPHDLVRPDPVSRQQHDPGPLRQPGQGRRRPHPRGQHLTITRRNLHLHSQWHEPSSASQNRRSRCLAHETLVAEQTRTINRLRWHLHELDWGWDPVPRSLVRKKVIATVAVRLVVLHRMVARIAALGTEITALEKEIAARVRVPAPSLLALPDAGDPTAAKIVDETAGVSRFRSKDAYARHAGTAPLPVWSGNWVWHRLSHTGNRQLICTIYRIAVTQKRCHPEAQAYLKKRIATGDTDAAALRAQTQDLRHCLPQAPGRLCGQQTVDAGQAASIGARRACNCARRCCYRQKG